LLIVVSMKNSLFSVCIFIGVMAFADSIDDEIIKNLDFFMNMEAIENEQVVLQMDALENESVIDSKSPEESDKKVNHGHQN
jgi:hypothetical protein